MEEWEHPIVKNAFYIVRKSKRVFLHFLLWNEFKYKRLRIKPGAIEYFDIRETSMSEAEKKQLNQLAGAILREAGFVFEEWKDYNWIKKESRDEGYADFYLVKCWNDSRIVNEADASIYHQLVDIDVKLGTDASTQLSCCLAWTTRWDIIKV